MVFILPWRGFCGCGITRWFVRGAMQQGVELASTVAAALRKLTGCFPMAAALPQKRVELGAQAGLVPRWWCLRGLTAEHHGALPLGRMDAEVGEGGRHARAYLLLMALGEFTCHLQGPLAEHRLQIFEQFQ